VEKGRREMGTQERAGKATKEEEEPPSGLASAIERSPWNDKKGKWRQDMRDPTEEMRTEKSGDRFLNRDSTRDSELKEER